MRETWRCHFHQVGSQASQYPSRLSGLCQSLLSQFCPVGSLRPLRASERLVFEKFDASRLGFYRCWQDLPLGKQISAVVSEVPNDLEVETLKWQRVPRDRRMCVACVSHVSVYDGCWG